MNIFNTIERFTQKNNLINNNDVIIIGLSGGPDSVFLLHFFIHLQKKYNLTLIAAHLNHEWRPEADQEEQLCRELAQKLNVTFVSEKLSLLSHAPKFNGSKEEYARSMRRYFLQNVAQQYNAHSVTLGHHALDQQETFFIRLIRSSSLAGLTAMKPRNKLYIRPLLDINKSDILTWLDAHNIAYATDLSNDSPDYLRNRIRNTVLPVLRSCDNRFDNNFLATLNRLQQDNNYLERITCETFDTISTIATIVTATETTTTNALTNKPKHLLNIPSFLNTVPELHHRLILHWLIAENVQFTPSEKLFNEIIRFLQSPRGRTHAIYEQWSIVKKKNIAFISKH